MRRQVVLLRLSIGPADNFSVSSSNRWCWCNIRAPWLPVAASILEKIQTALGLGQAFGGATTLDTSVLTLKQMREELNRLETQVKMTSSAVDAGVLFAYDDTDPFLHRHTRLTS